MLVIMWLRWKSLSEVFFGSIQSSVITPGYMEKHEKLGDTEVFSICCIYVHIYTNTDS